jgi:cytosolic iron-sulfur protein assembly protein CIAO1
MEPMDAETGTLTELTAIEAHLDRCWHLALHPSLSLLASSSSDQTVNIYNPESAALIATLKGQHSRSIRASHWKPSSQPALATASFDGSVGIWRPENDDGREGQEWECVAQLEGHENECKYVAWSSDGQYIATCSRDKSVWIWEGSRRSELQQLTGSRRG